MLRFSRLRRAMMFPSKSPVRFALILIVFLVITYNLIPITRAAPRVPLTFVSSTFDWAQVSPHHLSPPEDALPTTAPVSLPPVQHAFGQQPRFDVKIQAQRRNAVKAAFRRCWKSYKEYAWGWDELRPLSAEGQNTFGGWAATIFDSLGTLWIMDLKTEFYEAAELAVSMDWSNTTETACNIFETTIRYLGGLLSAYDLSGEPALLEKAVELGNMLYLGFDTPSQLPGFWLDFERARSGRLEAGTHEPAASSGTLSMELARLSQLTGDPKYYSVIYKLTSLMHQSQNSSSLPGMWPAFWNLRDLKLTEDRTFTLGALSDSMYEYLPKMHALLGGADPVYAEMYAHAAETIKENLLFRPMTPDQANILFSGTMDVSPNGQSVLHPEGQHLTCFVGGMFALGGRLLQKPEHVELGARLARGCAWGYQSFPTGVLPEIFKLVTCPTRDECPWDEAKWKNEVKADNSDQDRMPQGFRNARDARYILRPEALESLFVLYRVTGEEEFREAAWDMFQAIQKATETPFANAAIEDVTVTGNPTQRDSMESFWFAETLKYLYLIFSPPDVISLDDWVLNTEAHPFRRPKR